MSGSVESQALLVGRELECDRDVARGELTRQSEFVLLKAAKVLSVSLRKRDRSCRCRPGLTARQAFGVALLEASWCTTGG